MAKIFSLWTTSGPSSSYVSCEITVFMKESLHPQPPDVRSTVATQTAAKNEKKTRLCLHRCNNRCPLPRRDIPRGVRNNLQVDTLQSHRATKSQQAHCEVRAVLSGAHPAARQGFQLLIQRLGETFEHGVAACDDAIPPHLPPPVNRTRPDNANVREDGESVARGPCRKMRT